MNHDSNSTSKTKKGSLVWVVAIVGIFLSLAFFYTYRSWEKSHIQAEFNIIGQRNFLAVKEALHNHFLILRSIRAFYESSNYVDREEFYTFTRAFLEKNWTIQALEWIPLVKHEQREAFEAKHREQLPGFRIRERSPEGEMVKRRPADEYFPVTYLEPMKGNEAAVGFDLASNQARLTALEYSRQQHKMVATARIKLVQDKGGAYGFLLFAPVFRDPDTKIDLQGFILGVFRIGDMVKESTEQLRIDTEKAGIKLVDVTDPAASALLYQSPGFVHGNGYHLQKEFEVGGRRWKIIIIPPSEFIALHKSNFDVIGLTAGLLFTLLVSGYLKTIVTQSDEIRRQVLERTEELNNVRKGLETLINSVEDGIILINVKKEIRMFNPAAERIFQYTSQEVMGKNVKLLMPEPYHSNHDTYVNNYLNSGMSKIIGSGRDVKGRRKDGTVFPMHLAISEMEMENTRHFVGSIIDMTTQKEAEENLILAKEAAEKANRIKSEFMNTMSHELRTPLTIILGNIDELVDEDGLPDPDEIADIARDCSKAGELLMQLINDILDISKIEAGKMPLHREMIQSDELIGDVTTTARVLAENKGLELVVTGDTATLDIDPVRIKQTLFNLLSNAVKFTDSGSVSVITETRDDWFVIRVADTGCGMDKESLAYIFDPFRQVDGSATRKAGGTGLGLAITKKLVELHKGVVSVESEVNKGSSFIIKLPLNVEGRS